MKPYQPIPTNRSNVVRYAVMHFAITCAAASTLLGKLSLHYSADRIYLLTVLYNTIAITGQGLVALFADRVRNKHTGVRLAVLVFMMGFFWPIAFGVRQKVILMALGHCLFTAFSTSSLLARCQGRTRDIGLYLAGGAVGLAFATYAPLLGYFSTVLLMAFATPSDLAEELPALIEKREKAAPKTRLSFLFVPLFTLMAGLGGFAVASLDFSWNTWFKTAILLLFAMAGGRAVGGVLTDLVGGLTVLVGSLGGGIALLLTCADSKLLALGGIALLSMAAAPFTMIAFRYLPHSPAFLFALLSGAAYFGDIAAKVHPYSSLVLPVVGGLVLLLAVTSELYLYAKGKKEATPHA